VQIIPLRQKIEMNQITTIKYILPSAQEWIDFIQSFRDANIFHHPDWINLIAETYQYEAKILVALDAQGTILAGIPLLEVNSFITGKQLISLPFSDHCSPLYSDIHALENLINHLTEMYKSKAYKKLEIKWELPHHEHVFPYSDHALYTIPLAPTVKETFCNIQKRTRKYINNAQQAGLTIVIGQSQEHIQEFYRLQVMTRVKHGVPVQPENFFKSIGDNLLSKNLGFVLLAYKDGKCIAGKVVLYWKDTLTFKYSASDEIYLSLYPNYLLTWTAIKWAVENHYRQIDMGRCANSNEGLRNYKLKWGAEAKPLIYTAFAPVKHSPSGGRLMDVVGFVIKYSPSMVCKLAGKIFYKHFP
jgi:CelD/BcsL family acetyltransferase involved in cellulose biosynthesis